MRINARRIPLLLALLLPLAVLTMPAHAEENLLLNPNFWGRYDSATNDWIHATGEQVTEAIARGVDVRARDERNCTPLHLAARAGRKEAVKALLGKLKETGEVESAINAVDENNESPLHVAARWNRDPDVVELLLMEQAKMDVRDKDNYTPLMSAARWNENPKVLQEFLDAGADGIETTWDYNMTPLHFAAADNRAEVVRLLLERGANVNAWSALGQPLELARKFNPDKEVETVLLEHGAWD